MNTTDRRSEDRYDTDGELRLSLNDPMPQQITGTLLDYSRNGFRARHHCAELHTGQLVQFEHLIASGTARVIWNRILPEQVESGFLVVRAA